MNALLTEFLDWVASRPRTYIETMEAWRTSCPRQSLWEDALIDGLIQVKHDGVAGQPKVILTPRGFSTLSQQFSDKP